MAQKKKSEPKTSLAKPRSPANDPARWVVGAEVIVTEDGNRMGGGRFRVAKVGRRWMTIDGAYTRRQFDVETGQENSKGIGGFCFAMTPEAYAESKRRYRAIANFRGLVGYGMPSLDNVSTDAAEQICRIITAERAGLPPPMSWSEGRRAGLMEAAKTVAAKSDLIRGTRGSVKRACYELDLTVIDLETAAKEGAK